MLDVFFRLIREIWTIIFFTKIDFFRRIGEFICIIQKKAVILQPVYRGVDNKEEK